MRCAAANLQQALEAALGALILLAAHRRAKSRSRLRKEAQSCRAGAEPSRLANASRLTLSAAVADHGDRQRRNPPRREKREAVGAVQHDLCCIYLYYLTLDGSFSAVSTATIARTDAFCSIVRDLEDQLD